MPLLSPLRLTGAHALIGHEMTDLLLIFTQN